MFGLGFTEIVVLGLIALIFIGPEDLPKVARSVGRFLNEIKRGGDSFKEEFQRSAREIEKDIRVHEEDPAVHHPPPVADPVMEEPVHEPVIQTETGETPAEASPTSKKDDPA